MSKEEAVAPPEATAGEEELQKKLEESEKKAAEYLASWQRARADLLNYKKEEMERVGEFLKYANEEFVLRILPILDNFEIATRLRSVNDEASARQGKEGDIIEGFLQIKKQIQDFLKSQGVEEVKTGEEKFDLNFMEAVEKAEAERKGYTINGRLLRPAKVKIIK